MDKPSEEALEECKYLWDGSEPGWCLFYSGSGEPGNDAEFSIIHEPTQSALIIEDDDVWREVIRRMRAAGARIITPKDVKKQTRNT